MNSENREQHFQEILNFLKEKNKKGFLQWRALERIIENDLNTFKISSEQSGSILNEAVERYVDARLNGKIIKKYAYRSWLLRTSFNIIRDKSKKTKKEFVCDTNSSFISNKIEKNNFQNIYNLEDHVLILEVYETLSVEEQELAYLRFILELSYKEIIKESIYFSDKSVGTVTQKVSRLRKKMRKLYNEYKTKIIIKKAS